ncbi:MAG: hypothetical protein P4M07_10020 [Xanthobacteraceae bacterium]|nr:hypothetical protein [Xanthobacteraceae bacterium]
MLVSRSAPLRRRLNVVMTSWHKLLNDVRDPYRPELHYMRGPGPCWHAKQEARVGGDAR